MLSISVEEAPEPGRGEVTFCQLEVKPRPKPGLSQTTTLPPNRSKPWLFIFISSARLPPKLKSCTYFDYAHFLFFPTKIKKHKKFSKENHIHFTWSEGTLFCLERLSLCFPLRVPPNSTFYYISLTSSLTFSQLFREAGRNISCLI